MQWQKTFNYLPFCCPPEDEALRSSGASKACLPLSPIMFVKRQVVTVPLSVVRLALANAS